MSQVIIHRDIELYHHGILGMHWGRRNGPPYPLGSSDHSASEKKAGWRKSLGGGRNEKEYGKKKQPESKPKKERKKLTAEQKRKIAIAATATALTAIGAVAVYHNRDKIAGLVSNGKKFTTSELNSMGIKTFEPERIGIETVEPGRTALERFGANTIYNDPVLAEERRQIDNFREARKAYLNGTLVNKVANDSGIQKDPHSYIIDRYNSIKPEIDDILGKSKLTSDDFHGIKKSFVQSKDLLNKIASREKEELEKAKELLRSGKASKEGYEKLVQDTQHRYGPIKTVLGRDSGKFDIMDFVKNGDPDFSRAAKNIFDSTSDKMNKGMQEINKMGGSVKNQSTMEKALMDSIEAERGERLSGLVQEYLKSFESDTPYLEVLRSIKDRG